MIDSLVTCTKTKNSFLLKDEEKLSISLSFLCNHCAKTKLRDTTSVVRISVKRKPLVGNSRKKRFSKVHEVDNNLVSLARQ